MKEWLMFFPALVEFIKIVLGLFSKAKEGSKKKPSEIVHEVNDKLKKVKEAKSEKELDDSLRDVAKLFNKL